MRLRHLGPGLVLLLSAGLATAATPATAEDIVVLGNRAGQLERLARHSGLSVGDVQMVLGLRRPGYAEYVRSYAWSHRRLRAALGRDRYERLFAAAPRPLDARLADATAGLPPR